MIFPVPLDSSHMFINKKLFNYLFTNGRILVKMKPIAPNAVQTITSSLATKKKENGTIMEQEWKMNLNMNSI
jgi:hypothetical protein